MSRREREWCIARRLTRRAPLRPTRFCNKAATPNSISSRETSSSYIALLIVGLMFLVAGWGDGSGSDTPEIEISDEQLLPQIST